MSLSSLLFIPRLFKYSIMFCSDQGGREKIDMTNHILWFPTRKSDPILNMFQELMLDAAVILAVDISYLPFNERTSAHAPQWKQTAGIWSQQGTDLAVVKLKQWLLVIISRKPYFISYRRGLDPEFNFFPTTSYAICVEQFCDVKFNQNQNQENHTKLASLSVLIWRKSVALYLFDIQWIYMLALFTYSASYISLNVFSDCLKSCVHVIFNNVVVTHVSFFLD